MPFIVLTTIPADRRRPSAPDRGPAQAAGRGRLPPLLFVDLAGRRAARLCPGGPPGPAAPAAPVRRRPVRPGGAGDPDRLESPDEIGELARSFDRMAGRIETLMAAERRLAPGRLARAEVAAGQARLRDRARPDRRRPGRGPRPDQAGRRPALEPSRRAAPAHHRRGRPRRPGGQTYRA